MFETLRHIKTNNVVANKKETSALKFFGLFKSKEERARAKLEKKRTWANTELHHDMKRLQTKHDYLEKVVKGLEEHFVILRETITGKKADPHAFEKLEHKDDMIVGHSAGLKCIDNLPHYTSFIATLLAVAPDSPYPEIDPKSDHTGVHKSAESIFEDALYVGDMHDCVTKYHEAGYAVTYPKEFIDLRNKIIPSLKQLTVDTTAATEYSKRCLVAVGSCADINQIETIVDRSRTLSYFITETHPVSVVLYLLHYALDIAKHCYE